MRKRWRLGLIFSLVLVVGLGAALVSADGVLDPTYGVDGVVQINDSTLVDAVIQGDDRLLLGVSSNANGDLLRLDQNGDPDLAFYDNGYANVSDIFNKTLRIGQMLFQDDEKIVMLASEPDDNKVLWVLRMNPDGTPDTGFGTEGAIQATIPDNVVMFSRKGNIDSDGNIIVAGSVLLPSETYPVFNVYIMRFTQDGQLDTSFNDIGYFYIHVNDGIDYIVTGVQQQSDGKYVISVRCPSSAIEEWLLVRVNTDGTLDPTFGTDGIVRFSDQVNIDFNMEFVILPDGKFLLIGGKLRSADIQDLILVRLLPDGSLDPSFGDGGYDVYPVCEEVSIVDDLITLGDGRYAVAGVCRCSRYYNNFGPGHTFVVRLLSDGSVDTSFGSDGAQFVDVSSSWVSLFSTTAKVNAQSDGKPVLSFYEYADGLDVYSVRFVSPIAVPTLTPTPTVIPNQSRHRYQR